MSLFAIGEPQPVAASQPGTAEKPVIGVPGVDGSAGTLLSPTVVSWKNVPAALPLPSLYSVLLIAPTRPPAIWSARATRPAHCGEPQLVPPKPNTNVPGAPHAEMSAGVQLMMIRIECPSDAEYAMSG